ncbi:MAG: M20/M25/M40 family metallo-hydrolase [Gemmatimonadota bacterium]|nr:M20/M25/M40 family metallo-hydrolase [Gemmatimonadota bacterium]
MTAPARRSALLAALLLPLALACAGAPPSSGPPAGPAAAPSPAAAPDGDASAPGPGAPAPGPGGAPVPRPPPPTVTLTAREAAVADAVDRLAPEAIGFLERVVNVNSGTMNHAGVREVGRLFGERLAALGLDTTWVPMPVEVNRAGHLFAERRGGDGPTILLIGHLDTVFERHDPFQRYEEPGDGTARGPGVADMKGGNVVILLALEALQAAGALDGMNVIVALTGDEEETGKPLTIARAPLLAAARRSDAALGFEGGVGGRNSATVARRGFTEWRVETTAPGGHSSGIFGARAGAGAAFEAARILNAFYTKLRGEEHLTFGAGILLGGTQVEYDPETDRGTAFGKTNVIPVRVVMAGDLRTLTTAQLERAKRRMRRIVDDHLPHAGAEIEFRDSYPPMAPAPGNLALLSVLDGVSRDLGLGPVQAVDPGRRGAADISFAAQHAPALGGLGVVGSGAHSPRETVDLASIPVMAKRTALLLLRLSRDGVPAP